MSIEGATHPGTGAAMIALSVLDQSPIGNGRSAADAIQETMALAQAAETLGYRRYWLAEHHNSAVFASPAPEILIAAIAARTATIRIGAAGVLLAHYSPLKVAETFRLLHTLFPDRVDLGIGRAPGGDRRATLALGERTGISGADAFPAQLRDLLDYMGDTMPDGHPYAGVRAMPAGRGKPAVWLLGSSETSGAHAARMGLAFAFAHFISGDEGAGVLAAYRRGFQPSPSLAAPQSSVAVRVLCADTEDEAQRLAGSFWLWRLRKARGQDGPVPSADEAAGHAYTDQDRAFMRRNRDLIVVGDPGHIKASLTSLAAAYGVEELAILTMCHDPAARLRSYSLLAEVFALGMPPAETYLASHGSPANRLAAGVGRR